MQKHGEAKLETCIRSELITCNEFVFESFKQLVRHLSAHI